MRKLKVLHCIAAVTLSNVLTVLLLAKIVFFSVDELFSVKSNLYSVSYIVLKSLFTLVNFSRRCARKQKWSSFSEHV